MQSLICWRLIYAGRQGVLAVVLKVTEPDRYQGKGKTA